MIVDGGWVLHGSRCLIGTRQMCRSHSHPCQKTVSHPIASKSHAFMLLLFLDLDNQKGSVHGLVHFRGILLAF